MDRKVVIESKYLQVQQSIKQRLVKFYIHIKKVRKFDYNGSNNSVIPGSEAKFHAYLWNVCRFT